MVEHAKRRTGDFVPSIHTYIFGKKIPKIKSIPLPHIHLEEKLNKYVVQHATRKTGDFVPTVHT